MRKTANTDAAPSPDLEDYVQKEDFEVVEDKVRKLEMAIDETMQQLHNKLKDKLSKKDIDASLSKSRFISDRQFCRRC